MLFEGGFLRWELIHPPERARRVDSLDEAAELAGFKPRLPDWTALGEPSQDFTVFFLGAGGATITIDVTRLRQILQERHAKDVTVPQAWDGVQFIAERGPTIFVEFNRDVILEQSPQGALKIPPDFPFDQFMRLLMRDTPPAERAKIGFGDMIQGIEPDPEIEVHQVRLNSGRGVFVKNNSDHDTRSHSCFFCPVQSHESVLVWLVPDREFVLRGDRLSEEALVRVANAIK